MPQLSDQHLAGRLILHTGSKRQKIVEPLRGPPGGGAYNAYRLTQRWCAEWPQLKLRFAKAFGTEPSGWFCWTIGSAPHTTLINPIQQGSNTQPYPTRLCFISWHLATTHLQWCFAYGASGVYRCSCTDTSSLDLSPPDNPIAIA